VIFRVGPIATPTGPLSEFLEDPWKKSLLTRGSLRGGEDLNLRPKDYEAGDRRFSHLREWLKLLVRSFTRLL
jgi:hypothetical protein